MAWKKDEDGRLAVDGNGNPIWVTDGTGEEKAVDYTAMSKRLTEVNAESKSRKEELRTLKEKYAALADIEDLPAYLEEASKAIEMARNAPERDKDIEAQVQSRLAAATDPLKGQIAAKDKVIADKDKAYAELLAKYHFSSIVTDVQASKMLMRAQPLVKEFLQDTLERCGAVDDNGKVYYRYKDGETIYGEDGGPANADEAIVGILKKLGKDPAEYFISPSPDTSGSGGSASGIRGFQTVANPWKRESWNTTEQHRMWKNNNTQARAMMKAAGIPVPA